MSKITIEQVEKLQARANVSIEEAKDALENCDGDILEALIQLEKEGKTAAPGSGAYSTNGNAQEQNEQGSYSQGSPHIDYGQGNGQYKESDFSKQAKSVWQSFLGLLRKGNTNHFVVSKNQEEVIRMPITLLVLLLLIFNGAALIALLIFLFLGFKYSFDGPNMGKQSINNVMNTASDVAEDIKDSVKNSTAAADEGQNDNESE